MQTKEKLQQILDRKTESLKNLCYVLDGAYDWFEVFCVVGINQENRDEFFKTIMAFSKAYTDYLETKKSIEVLKYVLDIKDE